MPPPTNPHPLAPVHYSSLSPPSPNGIHFYPKGFPDFCIHSVSAVLQHCSTADSVKKRRRKRKKMKNLLSELVECLLSTGPTPSSYRNVFFGRSSVFLMRLHQLGPSGPRWSKSRHVRPSVCLFVCLSVCAIGCSFFPRPLIGPQIT